MKNKKPNFDKWLEKAEGNINLFKIDENFKKLDQDREGDQKFDQKGKAFGMVHKMTWITFILVIMIIGSQVMDISISNKEMKFVELTDQRLGIILTGFLAEMFLLTRIILQGLYPNREK